MPADKDGHGPRSGKSRSSDSHSPSPTANLAPRRRASNITDSTLATSSDRQPSETAAAHSSHSSGSSAASLSTARPDSHRDSFYSILEDPFFQDFQPTAPTRSGSDSHNEKPPVTSAPEGDEKSPKKRWPPPRRESLMPGNSHFWSQPPSPSSMESFNVAIIGSSGVGKSSFIQKVLGLSRPPISSTSSVRMVVDNITHMITLLELDLEHFELSPTAPIQWPKQINGHIVPRVDAALILYDVTNQETIRDLPQTLAALTNSGLSSILVATKCEHPEDEWEVDAEAMSNHKYFQACIATYKVSTETPEVAQENGETVARRRAQSNLETPEPFSVRPVSEHSKHSRASSDLSLLKGFANPPVTENYRNQSSKSPRLGQQLNSSSSSVPSDPENGSHQSYNSMLRSSSGIRLDKQGDSLLDVDESDAESHRYSDDIPILQRNDDNNIEKSGKTAGVSFDELVDRLLAPRLSKGDANFSDIFLCLYRKFAAPGDLFSAILARLDRVRDDKAAHYLSRTATQLRIIEVVAKWVSLYPGDFARPATRKNLEEFIKHLSTEPIFSIAAQQMRRNLHLNVVEDDDTGWANADENGDSAGNQHPSKEAGELAVGVSTLQFDDDADGRPSEGSDADRGSSVGSQFQFHSYDEYEREAARLEPKDHLPMNKYRYHIFMDEPDDDIADELTKIDWVMFSSIRIRDFVRHVSLSATQKEKCKSLRNVNRMISHFNHIAQWVANMILLRDKAKHRAQVLEKFMNIALKLRQLNNYNGLAAILAGINGTAIHRLSQTRNLVPADVQKRFARLVILMGTQKSHFAYRLAWENSPLPRIPFIPLHRRDLVSAEEGSRTFVGQKGDRVNWKKFEVLGEVLLPIMKSQGTPYPSLAKNDNVRDMILGCRMPTDDEEIYQRSVQVESGGGGSMDQGRKKAFPWFAK
ncbi:hypothetical protein ACO1O0_006393 [Amphichorda felina]